jgi:hypothetical protein
MLGAFVIHGLNVPHVPQPRANPLPAGTLCDSR